DRALTRAVRLRNPPVRGRGRGPRGPGAGPRGADAAGDPPDVRSPEAVTVSTSTQIRNGIADASPGARWASPRRTHYTDTSRPLGRLGGNSGSSTARSDN